jgi:hypothetical protein
MQVKVKVTPEMRVQLQYAQVLTIDISEFVVDAYKDGFMKGYNQQESLIAPNVEAQKSALKYAETAVKDIENL